LTTDRWGTGLGDKGRDNGGECAGRKTGDDTTGICDGSDLAKLARGGVRLQIMDSWDDAPVMTAAPIRKMTEAI
jgi:hypothetical protein